MTVAIPDPAQKIIDDCRAKEHPIEKFDVIKLACELADGVARTKWSSGLKGGTMAAGCVYIAAQLVGDRVNQKELADLFDVSAVAMRNHYRDIPRVYLDNVSDHQECVEPHLEELRRRARNNASQHGLDPTPYEVVVRG